jgi:dihydropteroate synthase
METKVMGVLHVAPHAPAAGGPPAARVAVARGRELISAGADIIEVAFAPAAPGRRPTHPVMESRQIRAVVSTLMSEVRLAVRTASPSVAAAAVGAGATLICEVSQAATAGDGGDALPALAAEAGAGWVAVHGADTPDAGCDLEQAAAALSSRAESAGAAGVKEVYIDPGIGTGRPPDDDLELLSGLERLGALDWPLVVGAGDGPFVDALHAAADTVASPPPADAVAGSGGWGHPDADRLEGELAVAVWAMAAGAAVIRTHHVAETVEAARTVGAKTPAGAP